MLEAVVHIDPVTELDLQTCITPENVTSVLTWREGNFLHYRMRVNGRVIDEGGIECSTPLLPG